MRVLVTGASGYVGGRLVSALALRGDTVLATGIPGSEASIPSLAGVARVGVDLADGAALVAAAHGADLVVHLAGVLPGATPADFERVNVEGTANIARAALEAGARRFVFLSSTAVYRPSPLLWPLSEDAPLNEPLPGRGARGYGESKVAAERELHEILGAGRCAAAVLRASTVYGPGSRTASWISGLLGRPLLGVSSRWGTPSMQWVHVDDLVGALLEAGERADAAGATLNIAGRELFSGYELLTAAEAVVSGVEPAPCQGPEGLLRFGVDAAAAALSFRPRRLANGLRSSLAAPVAR